MSFQNLQRKEKKPGLVSHCTDVFDKKIMIENIIFLTFNKFTLVHMLSFMGEAKPTTKEYCQKFSLNGSLSAKSGHRFDMGVGCINF